jgi:hypothetical protein
MTETRPTDAARSEIRREPDLPSPPPPLDRARLLLLREEQLFRDPFGSGAPSGR